MAPATEESQMLVMHKNKGKRQNRTPFHRDKCRERSISFDLAHCTNISYPGLPRKTDEKVRLDVTIFHTMLISKRTRKGYSARANSCMQCNAHYPSTSER